MKNLKEIRESKNITQEKLAEMCGVVRQTIGNIETGMNKPSVSLAKKLGEALGVPWYELYEEESE